MSESADTASHVSGGQLVVETLRALGVRHVFGVPGGQTLAITDALIDADDIQFIAARHEGAAACMADMAGRMTGLPGVCLATTGPGATNLLTGVGGAFRDSSPVLVLTCNNRLADIGRDDAQAADHVDIFRPLTKWATLVVRTETIPSTLDEAALQATTGCPGPVLVDFARDALEGHTERAHAPVRAQVRHVRQHRVAASDSAIRDTAERLLRSRRPVVWVGNGIQLSDASKAVLDLAEALALPVITTFNALGALPSDHPNVFGPLSRMGTELGFRVLADADLLLAVGNSLNAISTSRWNIDLPEDIVQIDISPEYLGRNYPGRTTGVLGDARQVLQQLLEVIRGDAEKSSEDHRARSERLGLLRTAKADWWAKATRRAEPNASPIPPDALVGAVRSVAPDDTILVVDAGNPGVWTHLWQVRQPGTYFKPVGFGNMGFGLPAAISAKLHEPNRTVIGLIGDGSLGMTLGDLETIVRTGVNPCLVIMNDGGYGNIRQEQLVHYGDRTIGVDLADVDYAAVARACGMQGTTAESVAELTDAIDKVLSAGEAGLIDARIDPHTNAWTYPLFQRFDLEQ